jgi:predicted branched-subunit amino acid permease
MRGQRQRAQAPTGAATIGDDTNRAGARQGVRDAVPVMVAHTPFALALGAALASTSVDPWVAWSSSALMFGGAAQLAAVQLLDQGAAVAVVVLTALVINARHLLYSASVARHTRDWAARWRWSGAHLMADPGYALAIARYESPDGDGSRGSRLGYYLAVGITCFLAWQVLTGSVPCPSAASPPNCRWRWPHR